MKKWTDEDRELVKLLLNSGMSVGEVSAETEIPYGTIAGWKAKWGITYKKCYKELYKGTVEEVRARLIEIMRNAPEISYNYFNSATSNVPSATTYRKYFGSWEAALAAAGVQNAYKQARTYTREELIKIMRTAPIVSSDYFNSPDSGTPCAETYRKYFGSWHAALDAAGIEANRSTLKPDRTTILYLVLFENSYYKVGITQQSVKARLSHNYPPYVLVISKEYPDLATAKTCEDRILGLVKDCKYIPTNFPAEGRGFTECFKPTNELLEEIYKILKE